MCLIDTYSKVLAHKNQLDEFPIQISRHGFLNFALAYDTRKVLENQEGLELNGINLILIYADNVNTLVENMNTINKNREAARSW